MMIPEVHWAFFNRKCVDFLKNMEPGIVNVAIGSKMRANIWWEGLGFCTGEGQESAFHEFFVGSTC